MMLENKRDIYMGSKKLLTL